MLIGALEGGGVGEISIGDGAGAVVVGVDCARGVACIGDVIELGGAIGCAGGARGA